MIDSRRINAPQHTVVVANEQRTFLLDWCARVCVYIYERQRGISVLNLSCMLVYTVFASVVYSFIQQKLYSYRAMCVK